MREHVRDMVCARCNRRFRQGIRHLPPSCDLNVVLQSMHVDDESVEAMIERTGLTRTAVYQRLHRLGLTDATRAIRGAG
jgi:hypothetical protein